MEEAVFYTHQNALHHEASRAAVQLLFKDVVKLLERLDLHTLSYTLSYILSYILSHRVFTSLGKLHCETDVYRFISCSSLTLF